MIEHHVFQSFHNEAWWGILYAYQADTQETARAVLTYSGLLQPWQE